MDEPLISGSTWVRDLGLALGLGLIVGLEREWSDQKVAGIRTFAMITLLGAICSRLAVHFGGSVVALGFAATAALMIAGTWALVRSGRSDAGMTTEVAALVMFAVGAAIPLGHAVPAVVVTGVVAVLLYSKRSLHAWVDRIGTADLRAIVRLVLIGLVILPVMPDRDFGPYAVLNLREIWTMVVLIVGLSLAAYAAYKLLGPQKGTLVSGVLGGLISSTAATMGFAKRARESGGQAGPAAVMILIASSVVFVRVILEIAAAAPSHLRAMAPPIAALFVFTGLLVAWAVLAKREKLEALPQEEPPSDLKGAIAFGLLFAVVLVAVAFARERFGESGLYAVAVISGLTDVDAITLSTSAMVEAGRVEPSTGWRAILIGVLANLIFKGGMAASIGGRELAFRVARYFVPAFLAGIAAIAFWP